MLGCAHMRVFFRPASINCTQSPGEYRRMHVRTHTYTYVKYIYIFEKSCSNPIILIRTMCTCTICKCIVHASGTLNQLNWHIFLKIELHAQRSTANTDRESLRTGRVSVSARVHVSIKCCCFFAVQLCFNLHTTATDVGACWLSRCAACSLSNPWRVHASAQYTLQHKYSGLIRTERPRVRFR